MQDDDSAAGPGAAAGQALKRAAPPLTRAAPLLWALVALAIAGLITAAVLSLLRAASGPRPPFLDMPASSAAPAAASVSPRARAGSLIVAGSGSNLPLTRALVEAFLRRRQDAKIIVPESIGSSGGVRAARDGAIDVGLISRPLSEEEAKLGLTVTPYARVPIVVAANPSVADACVRSLDLPPMYAGLAPRWSDGGRVVMLQRERGDSSFLAVSRLVPGLDAANDEAYRDARWRVLYDDRSMQEALMATEGAAGIFDLGAISAQRLPIKVLCVDGVAPSVEGAASGRYPYWKDLSFVLPRALSALAGDLVRFAAGAEGRAITLGLGYAPLPLEPAAEEGRP